jgi:hypothetical protein
MRTGRTERQINMYESGNDIVTCVTPKDVPSGGLVDEKLLREPRT